MWEKSTLSCIELIRGEPMGVESPVAWVAKEQLFFLLHLNAIAEEETGHRVTGLTLTKFLQDVLITWFLLTPAKALRLIMPIPDKTAQQRTISTVFSSIFVLSLHFLDSTTQQPILFHVIWGCFKYAEKSTQNKYHC